MSKKKILSVMLALVLCFVLLAGCGSRDTGTGSDTTKPQEPASTGTEQENKQQSEQESSEGAEEESVYPISLSN